VIAAVLVARAVGRGMVAMAACLASFGALAAYSCSVTATSISTVYSPTVATANESTGSYTITCSRLGTDPASFNYTMDANNGLQPAGNQNRVQFGGAANRYNYQPYRNPGCVGEWRNTGGTDINGTLNFGGSLPASFTGPFYLCVPGPQPVDPAGTYTDTVTVTLRQQVAGPDPLLATSTFGVSVITTNSCQINVPPGPLTFNYTSFQGAPAVGSNSFGVRCTTGLFYSMSLDATSVLDNAVNLNYTLAVSAASANGNGITQNHAVNGTMAAGQSGLCAGGVCTNAAATNKTRTLTITY
jgi:spore coat protein U-like protein